MLFALHPARAIQAKALQQSVHALTALTTARAIKVCNITTKRSAALMSALSMPAPTGPA